jgi:hypothetical protein
MWFPRVPEASGRHYLNSVDDVKDHQPVRTVDMRYLVYRELLYPLGDWVHKVVDARNQYARKNRLPERSSASSGRILPPLLPPSARLVT